MRKAKILATIGPASESEVILESMLAAGLNAVRINMSHGNYDDHARRIKLARETAAKLGLPLAVLVDLSGPKIRTKTLDGGKSVFLTEGSKFVLTNREVIGDVNEVCTNYVDLPTVVTPGARVLLDDGAIELRVDSTTESDVITTVVVGGFLSERKGINLPNTTLPIPSMTIKDHADLEWAMTQNIDYVALSFVRTADDCREAKARIKELCTRKVGRPLLIAKIEKAEAIDNLLEIIKESDGLMVARGDLGVETSVELVPVYQKRIIELAIADDKMVITATQMLQSMIENPFPTRAEASDVANAVWDGTDAVMLSAETASGKHPVESIKTMVRIVDAAETIKADQLKKPVKFSQPASGRTSQALCKAAAYAAKEMRTEKVAVFTESGLMARRLSSVRSGLQTFALTTSPEVRNQLALVWGVRPFYHSELGHPDDTPSFGDTTAMSSLRTNSDETSDLLKIGEQTLLDASVVTEGETIIMMAGRLSGPGLSSSVVVWTIGESIPNR